MKKPIDINLEIGNLEDILTKHQMYLSEDEGGIKAPSLANQDLTSVDLSNRLLREIDFSNANLKNADVINADFRGADLRGANLDFAQLNISCKSLSFKICDKNAKMLLYMIFTIMEYSDIDISNLITSEMYEYLKDSHLVTEHELAELKPKGE